MGNWNKRISQYGWLRHILSDWDYKWAIGINLGDWAKLGDWEGRLEQIWATGTPLGDWGSDWGPIWATGPSIWAIEPHFGRLGPFWATETLSLAQPTYHLCSWPILIQNSWFSSSYDVKISRYHIHDIYNKFLWLKHWFLTKTYKSHFKLFF